MKEISTSSLKKILFPIMKIIIGGLFCILIPILINKLVLDNLFQELNFTDNLNRSLRVFITTIILMPLFYYFLFKKIENRKINELEFTKKGLPIIYGFLSSIVIIGISFTIPVIIGIISIYTVQIPKSIILNLIVILGLVITEEIFFRGIFYRIIEDSLGTVIALILSALIFSFMHLGNENTTVLSFISVITGGAVLGILYTYTKNLFVPIAFHFGWNFSQILLGFNLSGGSEFSSTAIFKLDISGSKIFSGGISGVENSIISVILLFLFFIWIAKHTVFIKFIRNKIIKGT